MFFHCEDTVLRSSNIGDCKTRTKQKRNGPKRNKQTRNERQQKRNQTEPMENYMFISLRTSCTGQNLTTLLNEALRTYRPI
jgi:hypothetical protein